MPPPKNADQRPQRPIDSLGIAEGRRHVRIEHHHLAAGLQTDCVFATHAFAEIYGSPVLDTSAPEATPTSHLPTP